MHHTHTRTRTRAHAHSVPVIISTILHMIVSQQNHCVTVKLMPDKTAPYEIRVSGIQRLRVSNNNSHIAGIAPPLLTTRESKYSSINIDTIQCFPQSGITGRLAPFLTTPLSLHSCRHSKQQYCHALPSVTYVGMRCGQHAS